MCNFEIFEHEATHLNVKSVSKDLKLVEHGALRQIASNGFAIKVWFEI